MRRHKLQGMPVHQMRPGESVIRVCLLAAALALGAHAEKAEGAEEEELPRPELEELFKKLEGASAAAKSFHALLKRIETTKLVLDEEPMVSEGELWVLRAEKRRLLRQEIRKPGRSLVVLKGDDLWIYFPEDNEVQHVNLKKGLKDREGTRAEDALSGLSFDLDELEKTYKVRGVETKPPEGVSLSEGELASTCYRLDFRPCEEGSAGELVRLTVWTDGRSAWPLALERETEEGDVMRYVFSEIELDKDIPRPLFEFKPPRGAKLVELSE